jgi:hypothetical protein
MTDTTKITGLTAMNASALRQTTADTDAVTVTNTTVTFHMPPAEAVRFMAALMQRVAAEHGARMHPYASLHAVVRKVQAAAEAAL